MRTCTSTYSSRKVFVILFLALSMLVYSCAGNEPRPVEPQAALVCSDTEAAVPEGWFTMGFSGGEVNERPAHDVYLSGFVIDRYEVSASEFAAFLNENGNPDGKYFTQNEYSTIIGIRQVNGETTEDTEHPEAYMARQGMERYPANNVSWYGADAYCRWKGEHLPTEAQWEKAARGTDGRLYPWGNEPPDASRARYGQKWSEKGFGVMVPVDVLEGGTSPYGVYNMSGNVWEWVNDWYRQNYCEFCDPSSQEYTRMASRLTGMKAVDSGAGNKDSAIPPMTNPSGPAVGSFKLLRGGSWYDSYGDVVTRSTYRFWLEPSDRYLNTGFRCAKLPGDNRKKSSK